MRAPRNMFLQDLDRLFNQLELRAAEAPTREPIEQVIRRRRNPDTRYCVGHSTIILYFCGGLCRIFSESPPPVEMSTRLCAYGIVQVLLWNVAPDETEATPVAPNVPLALPGF